MLSYNCIVRYYNGMLHHVQKHILDQLAIAESAPYGRLKPTSMDGNSFTYHLKQLLATKYISRTENGDYTLTQRGRTYIVHRYENASLQAHSIFLVVIKSGDHYLLRERLVQPLLGYSGFIHGEPKHDETLIEAAQHRVREKTGFDITLTVCSSGLISITHAGELQSYSHAVVLCGKLPSNQQFTEADSTGRNFLAEKTDFHSINLLQSCQDIITAIEQNTPWFEISYAI